MSEPPDQSLLSPIVLRRFDGLVRNGEHWIWADQPDKVALRALFWRMLSLGSGILALGVLFVAFGILFGANPESNFWVAAISIAIGFGLLIGGVGEAFRRFSEVRKLNSAAYALSNQRLICEFDNSQSQIIALEPRAITWIARRNRGRFSDFTFTIRNDPAKPAEMTFLIGIKNGDQVESLLKQALLGPGDPP